MPIYTNLIMSDEILNLLRSKVREVGRLGKKISEAETALASMKQELAVAEGEKNAFTQAAKLMGHLVTDDDAQTANQPASITRLDPEWVRILQIIFQRNLQQFGYEDVMAAGGMIRKELKKPSVRTQILSYVKSGVVERIVDGKFRFTAPIADELKMYNPPEVLDPVQQPAQIPKAVPPFDQTETPSIPMPGVPKSTGEVAASPDADPFDEFHRIVTGDANQGSG